ncbi:MAG: DUF5939 domain-containing protein, partial [Deltaproteobacteria bacterium]
MDSKLLSKINVLATRAPFANLTHELMRFGEALSQLTWEESYRINPISFSQRFSLPLSFSIEAFIHGTDLGLFEIAWNQICPGCGGVEYSVPRIEDIHPGGVHCTICNLDVQSHLDEQIEVSFRLINPTRRASVDLNKDPETFRKLYFSPNYERSAELNQYSKERLVQLVILNPKESTTLEFTTTPGANLYRALSVKNHTQALLKVIPSKGKNEIHLNLE